MRCMKINFSESTRKQNLKLYWTMKSNCRKIDLEFMIEAKGNINMEVTRFLKDRNIRYNI